MAIELKKPEKETLSLSDGTTLKVTKTPGVGPQEWEETKSYLEANPEEARRMEAFSKDAKQVRDWMQTEAIQDYYGSKLSYGDEGMTSKLMSLDKNPDFAHIFDDIKRGGVQAAMQHYHNEPLMLKLSRAMGGIPEEVKDRLTDLHKNPVTIQEACKMGNLKAVEDFLASPGDFDIDDKDAKGVSCLGYAIGANRAEVVKLLMSKKADPAAVDTSGGTGLHYAAAYGRTELLSYLITAGGKVNAANTQGQTPLALATKNKMTAAVDVLKSKGATA